MNLLLNEPAAIIVPRANEPATEQSSEVVTFRDRASLLTGRGIPVTPLQPKTKIAFIGGWEASCTTSREQIDAWNEANSEYNCAAVAQANPNGYWFFEVDSPGVVPRIEAETGQKIPRTFRVRSSPGRGHYYWRHSPASLAAGNISQNFVKNNDWSMRADRQYVAGPLSIHPRTGGVYEVVSDSPIVPAPDWLVNWLVSQKQEAKKSPPSIEGAKIPRGSHDTELTRIAGRLRSDGMEESMLAETLIEVCEKRCNDYGSDYREMCQKIAHSVCRYQVPPANPVLIGGVPVGLAKPTESKVAAEHDPAPKIVRMPYPVFPEWTMHGTSIYEGFVKPVCEQNSRVPYFMFMSAMTLLLNFVGTRVRIEYKDIIPSLFIIIVGKRGQSIKSGSVEHAIDYFRCVGLVDDGDLQMKNSEGKSLVWSVGSPEGLGLEMNRLNCANAVLYYDELTELVQKADIKSSTLGGKLLTLYESGKFQNVIKSRKESYSLPAHSYCCSFIACNTEENFTENWAKLSSGKKGLLDRFMFILQPEFLPPLKIQTVVPTHEGAKRTRALIEKAAAQRVYRIVDDTPLRETVGRIGNRAEIRAEKLALGFAIDLGRDEIDEDCIDRALAIIKYEKSVKNWLKSGESETWMASHQQKARLVLERAPDGRMTMREFEKACNAHRYDTETWSRVVFGLVKAGIIRIEGAGTKGDPEAVQLLVTMPQDDED